MDPGDQIRFDGWTLHRRSGELDRDGRRVRLQGQPLRVLEELLARPGELVTREELIARLWPSGVVDFDTALNSAVRRLRTALGDHAETPRYIETIPRRGYRFIVSIDLPAAGAATDAPRAAVTPPQPPSGTPMPPPPAARHPDARRRRWAAVAAGLALAGAALWLVAPTRHGTTAVEHPAGDAGHAEAQERLARAEHFLKRRAPGDGARARQYFAEAIELDPRLASAWAGLASAHFIEMVEGSVAAEVGLSRMRDAAERALALDPAVAEAHLRLASYRWLIGEAPAAERHLRDALALDPDNALALGQLASITAAAGQVEDAIALQRRAVQSDPAAAVHRFNLASFLYLAGHFGEASERLLEARELAPSQPRVDEMLGWLKILEGRPAEALAAVADSMPGAAREQVRALAYQALGERDRADGALAALIDLAQAEDPFRVAEVHAYRGEIDAAFAWLAIGRAHAAAWRPFEAGARPLWLARLSPWLRPLHADPRWPVAWPEAGPRQPATAVEQQRVLSAVTQTPPTRR